MDRNENNVNFVLVIHVFPCFYLYFRKWKTYKKKMLKMVEKKAPKVRVESQITFRY